MIRDVLGIDVLNQKRYKGRRAGKLWVMVAYKRLGVKKDVK